jgi:hypothetical protein
MPAPPSSAEEGTVPRLECALLGSFVLAPRLLEGAKELSPSDFSAPLRGRVLETMRELRDFDAPLLILGLERQGLAVPSGGWAVTIAKLTDEVVWDEALVPAYVQAIRSAAVLRERASLGLVRPGARR